MLVCSTLKGVPAVVFLELFEKLTGEAFSETPGTLIGSRVRPIANVLGNLAREKGSEIVAPVRWGGLGGLQASVQMAAADSGLVAWLKGHRFLVPTAVESGESGMALLLLWEVDHGCPFPSAGGGQGWQTPCWAPPSGCWRE